MRNRQIHCYVVGVMYVLYMFSLENMIRLTFQKFS